MGFMFAVGRCFGCSGTFTFNPDLVPSIPINGTKQPICKTCVERANPMRAANGLAPIVPLAGAYEETECV